MEWESSSYILSPSVSWKQFCGRFTQISYHCSSSKVISVFLLSLFTFSIRCFLLGNRRINYATTCLLSFSLFQCFSNCSLSFLFCQLFRLLLLFSLSCFFSFLFFFFLSISFSFLFINLCLGLLLFHFFFFVLFTFASLLLVNAKVIHHLLKLFILESLLFLLAQLLYWFSLYMQWLVHKAKFTYS